MEINFQNRSCFLKIEDGKRKWKRAMEADQLNLVLKWKWKKKNKGKRKKEKEKESSLLHE